jgi:hypothetical protein
MELGCWPEDVGARKQLIVASVTLSQSVGVPDSNTTSAVAS